MQKSTAMFFAGVSVAALAVFAARSASSADEDLPPQTGPGVTQFYGDAAPSGTPAWAAEATMNPDYSAAPSSSSSPSADAAADPAPVAAAEAEALPPQTPPGVTQFYGDTKPSAPPAWAAEAAMNPDYTAPTAEAPAASSETAAAAAAEPEATPPQTPPGVTSFYGDTKPSGVPAWAAEATMNSDYVATPATPTTSSAGDARAAQRQQQIETCRDALNGEIQAAKLNFRSGSWDIVAANYGTLDKVAKIATDCGDVAIEVGGHTDNEGRPASNQTISELRAQAVVRYLTRAGVDASKLKAVGHGDTKPVASNDTPEGRRQNRRIEFLVSDKSPPS